MESYKLDFESINLDFNFSNSLKSLVSCGLQGSYEYIENGTTKKIFIEQADDYNSFIAYTNGEAIPFRVLSKRDERLQTLRKTTHTNNSTGLLITAQMPGLIKEIFVTEGTKVSKGDALFILEAMKMENEIKSPIASIVKRVVALPGNPIEKGGFVLELEPIT